MVSIVEDLSKKKSAHKAHKRCIKTWSSNIQISRWSKMIHQLNYKIYLHFRDVNILLYAQIIQHKNHIIIEYWMFDG